MGAHQQTLRDRQVGRPANVEALTKSDFDISTASLEKILNFNHSSTTSDANGASYQASPAENGLIPPSTPILNDDGDPIWKVLVFDDLGRDVISSVLRVNDLRGWGVTIHLSVILMVAIEACFIATLTELVQEYQQPAAPHTRRSSSVPSRTDCSKPPSDES